MTILKTLIFVLGLIPLVGSSAPYQVNEVAYLSINSAITPATLDYLKYQLNRLPENTLAVVQMNTPGGLVTTTKDIITLIGAQRYPVVVWIGPEGASASSAGAIIASSAHFIYMAPGTNLGAATPVSLGEDIKEGDGKSKIVNDLTVLVRSLSQMRGRPGAPFEDMVRKSVSFSHQEALKLKIINGVALDMPSLLKDLQGKTFQIHGEEKTLHIKENVATRELSPTTGQKLLEVIAHPSLAYFLFLIGIALIYFEFQAPGGYIAGTAGAGLLVLAAIAFQVLPLDWGALGLLILGTVFFILEIFITSYGILAILGAISFILGSLFLFHGDDALISIEYPVIFSTLTGVLTAMGVIAWYLYRDQKNRPRNSDFFLPISSNGTVISQERDHYQVKVRGEIWRAQSDESLNLGDSVEVIEVNAKELKIKVTKN